MGTSSVVEGETSMKLCLQVRTKNLDHGDPYIYGDGEHKWFVVNFDDNAAKEIRGMSRKFPRDTASACYGSTVFLLGGEDIRKRKTKDTLTFPGEDPKFPDPIEPMDPISSDFWYTDTTTYYDDDDDDDDGLVYNNTSVSGCWILGPSMLQPRSRACAVRVSGAIYVFGGIRWPTPSTWAEVMYPGTNAWSTLYPPDDIWSLHVWKCFVVVFESDSDNTGLLNLISDSEKSIMGWEWNWDPDVDYYWEVDLDGMRYISEKPKKAKTRLILLYSPMTMRTICGFLWSYDLDLGTWDVLDPKFGSWADELVVSSITSSNTTSTTINRLLLLAVSEGLLRGYNLGEKKWLEDPISGLEGNDVLPPPNLMDRIRLVSLGGNNEKLCVLWSKYSSDWKALRVYCTKFTIYEDGPCSLVAKVEATIVFDIDNGDTLISCLAIAPGHVKKRGEISFMEDGEEEKKKKIKHQHP